MLICTVIPIKYRRLVWESVILMEENTDCRGPSGVSQ